MRHFHASLFFFLIALSVSVAQADSTATSQGSQALAALGHLNGQSLACQQAALSARTRQIVIDFVPKERQLGEVFEQATSEAFLKQGKEALPCPDSKVLVGRIDELEKTLKLSFPGQH